MTTDKAEKELASIRDQLRQAEEVYVAQLVLAMHTLERLHNSVDIGNGCGLGVRYSVADAHRDATLKFAVLRPHLVKRCEPRG